MRSGVGAFCRCSWCAWCRCFTEDFFGAVVEGEGELVCPARCARRAARAAPRADAPGADTNPNHRDAPISSHFIGVCIIDGRLPPEFRCPRAGGSLTIPIMAISKFV